MRTRKILAIVLAVVMAFASLTVVSFAGGGAVINSAPVKVDYLDDEFFNPMGLVISTSSAFYIEYSPLDENFAFEPALTDYLSVGMDSVKVYYNNEFVGEVEIFVDHNPGELVSLGKGGHGIFCTACGELLFSEEHTVSEWKPNGDAGLLTPETQTGKCDVCGDEVTVPIENTERIKNIFGQNGGQVEWLGEIGNTVLEYFIGIVVGLINAIRAI